MSSLKSQAIENMFRIAHGSYFMRNRLCVVIYGYFDGSSTHDGLKVLSLCGFLGDPRVWDDFDQEWQRVLNKSDWPHRPSEFHMVDCVHGTKEFEGWRLAERLAIFGDLASVITDSNVMALGSIFIADAFNNRTNTEKAILAKRGLRGPLDFAFQLLIQMAIARTRKYASIHEPPIREKLALIFDEEPRRIAERYHHLYDHHCAKHPDGDMLTGISFAKSNEFSPIQAADLLAYTTYHWELKRRFPNLSDFDFPIIPGFLRLIETIAAAGGVYDDEAMSRLIVTAQINQANRDAHP
jgi:Protein of unknown function (DUF3800)